MIIIIIILIIEIDVVNYNYGRDEFTHDVGHKEKVGRSVYGGRRQQQG
jgi:hypothetical protein